jgi:hypothetical protein
MSGSLVEASGPISFWLTLLNRLPGSHWVVDKSKYSKEIWKIEIKETQRF